MSGDLLPIERFALDAILRTNQRLDDATLNLLREQLQDARVVSRENSTAGAFADFEVRESLPRTDRPEFELAVNIRSPQCPSAGFGYVLFVRRGRIDWLEAFTYEVDEFPDPATIDPSDCNVEPDAAGA